MAAVTDQQHPLPDSPEQKRCQSLSTTPTPTQQAPPDEVVIETSLPAMAVSREVPPVMCLVSIRSELRDQCASGDLWHAWVLMILGLVIMGVFFLVKIL